MDDQHQQGVSESKTTRYVCRFVKSGIMDRSGNELLLKVLRKLEGKGTRNKKQDTRDTGQGKVAYDMRKSKKIRGLCSWC